MRSAYTKSVGNGSRSGNPPRHAAEPQLGYLGHRAPGTGHLSLCVGRIQHSTGFRSCYSKWALRLEGHSSTVRQPHRPNESKAAGSERAQTPVKTHSSDFISVKIKYFVAANIARCTVFLIPSALHSSSNQPNNSILKTPPSSKPHGSPQHLYY